VRRNSNGLIALGAVQHLALGAQQRCERNTAAPVGAERGYSIGGVVEVEEQVFCDGVLLAKEVEDEVLLVGSVDAHGHDIERPLAVHLEEPLELGEFSHAGAHHVAQKLSRRNLPVAFLRRALS